MYAIDQQRQRVKEEKARIKRIYHTASSNYSKANGDTSMIREDAVFEFRFHHFVSGDKLCMNVVKSHTRLLDLCC